MKDTNLVRRIRARRVGAAFLPAIVCAVVASSSSASLAVTVVEYPIPTANSRPWDIVAGPDGNLWFTEIRGSKIGKITPDGSVTEYPIPGPDSTPEDITLGPDGNLWFTTSRSISKITSGGAITQYTTPGAGGPVAITAGPDGNLWFTHPATSTIGKITTAGAITEFPTATNNALSITAGPDGNLWFAEELGNKIGKITTSGVVTQYPIPSAHSQPQDIITGPDGNLWFSEFFSDTPTFGKITPGGVITEYPVQYPNWFIAVGPDGNLWFTSQGFNISQITTSGTATAFDFPYPADNLQHGFIHIALGPDNNLWTTDYNGNRIAKIGLGVTSTGSNVATLAGTVVHNTKTGLDETVAVDATFASVASAGVTMVTATSSPTDVLQPDYTTDIGLCSKTKRFACAADDDCPTGETCVGYHGVAFDVSTTATVSGAVTVCSHYPDDEKRGRGNGYVDRTGKPGLPEESLRLLHEEGGTFVDITLPNYPDTINNVVCGQVSSLAAASAFGARDATQGRYRLAARTDMPGNGSRLDTDCMSEWSLGDPKAGNPAPPKKKRGTWFFPDSQLTCKSGSAACQAPMAGFCAFRFRVCLNSSDFRLPCQPSDVKEFQLFEPQLADPPTDNDSINAQRILEKLGSLSASSTFATQVSFNSPVASSACTDNIEVVLPANGVTRLVRLTASDSGGRADSNSLKLLCK